MTHTEPIKPSDILLGALDILSQSKHWTRHVAARNRHGESVFFADNDAYCFCLFGAVARASSDLGESVTSQVRDAANNAICDNVPGGLVLEFNDKGTHAKVVDLLTTAAFLQLAKEDEAI